MFTVTPTPTATDDAIATQTPARRSTEARSLFEDGVRLFESREFEKAIDAFTSAIRLNPQDADAHVNRGVAYVNLGQYQRAIEDYDQAIRLNPQDVVSYSNRGVSYLNLGRHPQWTEELSGPRKEGLADFNRRYGLTRHAAWLAEHRRAPW